MKSLMALWTTLAEELASWCSTCANRDVETVAARVKTEGVSFLTITLSNFGTDFQKSLAQGCVAHDAFAGFKRRGGLPAFLSGFLEQVFTLDGSRLLDEPNVDAVFAIRQLTLMFGKVQLDCTDARVKAAYRKFVECEQELKAHTFPNGDLQKFKEVSGVLFAEIFTKVDEDVYYERLVPRHGPGATADRILGNQKYNFRQWTTRLEECFPFGEYALPSWRYSYLHERVEFLEPEDEVPVRVITVPKTLKTPRIIAIEPVYMQYMQQAVLGGLMRAFHEDKILTKLIGFRDQRPNRTMAREGSRTGALATLDLSEASDRVSNQLVRTMLSNHPHLRGAVDACRSRKADVPGHGVSRLAKFASMGSALCFPMEAFVFTTIIFMAIAEELNQPVTKGLIKRYRGLVRVYGDDIIVPVEFAACVRTRLETFGFRVNTHKSFMEGNFRESCGGDYFRGEDVTPIRLRRLIPTSTRQASEMVSLVSFRNLLYTRGLWKTCAYLDQYISRKVTHYPVVHGTSPALGRLSFLPWQGERISARLHRPEVKAWTVTSKAPESKIPGEAALLKYLLAKEWNEDSAPLPDRHLEFAGRPPAVYLKLGWTTPF